MTVCTAKFKLDLFDNYHVCITMAKTQANLFNTLVLLTETSHESRLMSEHQTENANKKVEIVKHNNNI